MGAVADPGITPAHLHTYREGNRTIGITIYILTLKLPYTDLSISLALRIPKMEERKRRLYPRILKLYSIYWILKLPLQINRKNQIHKYFRVQSYMKVGSPNITISVTI